MQLLKISRPLAGTGELTIAALGSGVEMPPLAIAAIF
jgi:hypothetical protein